LWSCGGKGPVSKTAAHPTDNKDNYISEAETVQQDDSFATSVWAGFYKGQLQCT